ncbi:hypothetical protein MMC16_002139 [Acarospora aff. strigata]|nr:hypothetical protein [Acarospora aff. strigata]
MSSEGREYGEELGGWEEGGCMIHNYHGPVRVCEDSVGVGQFQRRGQAAQTGPEEDEVIMKPATILTLLTFGSLTVTAALPAVAERDASPAPRIDDGPSPPTVPSCWKHLGFTFEEIESSSMESRLAYMQYMALVHFSANAMNKFRAIEGVIQFFIDKGIGQPGTWVSYVDAGIIEAIQRGGAIALGKSGATVGNPGARKWTDYFARLEGGELKSRYVRANANLLLPVENCSPD